MPGLIPSRDELIGAARNGPQLLEQARTYDPALAKRLEGESLAQSKTVWGSLATMAVSWAVTRYGLGWDPTFSATVAGGLVLIVQAIIHWAANQPLIRGHLGAPEDVSYLDNKTQPPPSPPGAPS